MSITKSTRAVGKIATGKKLAKKSSRTTTFAKTKTKGRWIYVYDDDGKVIRQIMRPFGKTRIPLDQIRKNVRKVIAERLAREAEEDQ